MSLEQDISKLMEADIFKPASKEEVNRRTDVIVKRLSTPEVKEAIERVLNYLYEDEYKGWEEDGNEEGDPVNSGHILHFLNILADAVGWEGRR